MSWNFKVDDYCEAQLPDQQWFRGTIKGGPFLSDNNARYYRVHIHHPLNKYEMIWASQLRLDTRGYIKNDLNNSSSSQLQVSAPYSSSSTTQNATTMPLPDQFAAFTNQFMSVDGAAGLATPQTVCSSSVIPLKRPLDVSWQPVTSFAKAEITHPGLSNTASSPNTYSQNPVFNAADSLIPSAFMATFSGRTQD
ncbi:hypothetical protein N0V95_008018 [Ascochyta clinopodiicola]|nr:hypothetical protein N0V95_008018 [Ascochyta clinopodiicola]